MQFFFEKSGCSSVLIGALPSSPTLQQSQAFNPGSAFKPGFSWAGHRNFRARRQVFQENGGRAWQLPQSNLKYIKPGNENAEVGLGLHLYKAGFSRSETVVRYNLGLLDTPIIKVRRINLPFLKPFSNTLSTSMQNFSYPLPTCDT